MKINVVGLGKLGLPLAAVLNQRFDVYGIDLSKQRLEDIENKRISEPKVNYLLKKPLKTGTNYHKSDLDFICVPTPSLEDGTFSNDFVDEALKVAKNPVIVSTVMPGTCKERGVIYNPSFIALGSVVRNLTHPDFILIGIDGKPDIEPLLKVYREICPQVPIQIMTTYEAEVCKIALNCYITMKITFANHLSEICGDTSKILKTIGLDSRIGPKYLRAGLGYGGPCFPRDNRAFRAFAKSRGKRAELAKIVDKINKRQVYRMVSKIVDLKPKSVGFESLSYKEGSTNRDESHLLKIHDRLKEIGIKVKMGKGDITLDWWGIV